MKSFDDEFEHHVKRGATCWREEVSTAVKECRGSSFMVLIVLMFDQVFLFHSYEEDDDGKMRSC